MIRWPLVGELVVVSTCAFLGACEKAPPDPWAALRGALGDLPLTETLESELPPTAGAAVVVHGDRITVVRLGECILGPQDDLEPWQMALADGVVAEEALRGSMIEPLYDTLQERADDLKGCSAADPSFRFDGKLILVTERSVPWETVRQVMYTSGQAQFGEFHFWAGDAGGAT